MNWFGRKKKEETAQIEKLQEDVSSIAAQLTDVADSVSKLTRTQFKTAKKTEEKLGNMEASMVSSADLENSIARNSQLETEKELVIKRLIAHLDELDHVLSGITAEDNTWKDVLTGWAGEIKQNLETLGAYEMSVLGTSFNPRISESVKTVNHPENTQKNRVPYEIIEVYHRGFVTKDNQLIRKAIVATVKEDETNGNEE